MRSSALICWCSRFCATAGAATASTASASVDRTRFMCMPSLKSLLRRDNEMTTSILRPCVLGVGHVERGLLPVTYNSDPFRRNSERRHVGLHRDSPTFAESEVVLGRSPLVAMPFNGDSPRSVLLEDLRIGRRDRATRLVQFRTVEPEEHGLQRGVPVEVVERFVRARIVGFPCRDRYFVLDALCWRWRSRWHHRGFFSGRGLWPRGGFLLAARSGDGDGQCDRDYDRRVPHISHVLPQ